jgi:CRISPR-associated protein (TIGR02584 family)
MKTILLAVSGMSPAILTETVWALAKEKPAVIPDAVVAVTTRTGRAAIERELMTPLKEAGGLTMWQALRKSVLGKKAEKDPRLMLENCRVIHAPDGRTGQSQELRDIQSPQENEAAADFILDEVRKITFNDDVRLVASLAGGRKTMGALLYAAMSLLGREEDRLTHVLVNEPFDGRLLQSFYYPEQPEQELKAAGGQIVRAAEARPALADVPFVRLRKLFPKEIGKWPGNFTSLVRLYGERVEKMSAAPEVRLDEARAVALINGREIPLTGREFPLFCFLYDRAERGLRPLPGQLEAGEPLQAFMGQWLERHPENEAGKVWSREVGPEDIKKPLNTLREKLKRAGLGHLEAVLFPKRGPVGFGFEVGQVARRKVEKSRGS